jgi:SAM-dependent methyltransferase
MAVPGDSTERWRESYQRVRKDLLSDSQTTNRHRLAILGVSALPRHTRLLDIGTGDGNLFTTLEAEGFSKVWGLEYQPELIAGHPSKRRVVVASATHVPFSTGSMSAVIVMDVLHHLIPAQLPLSLAEMRRVLRPGGLLFVCEPASTLFRKLMTVLLMSPLSSLSRFARDKKIMVEEERATLDPWLKDEHSVPERIVAGRFRLEFFKRHWLHHYGRFRAI